jgi:orotate phosphoribosyltransferase
VLVSPSLRNEVVELLRSSGALRSGHFSLPSGEHTSTYFQLALALRQLSSWRILTVGLSRVLRLTREVSSLLPHVTIVGPASGGIPVAFGVREALAADRVVWAERTHESHNGQAAAGANRYHFRQFGGIRKGDRCVIVDDLLISGNTLGEMIDLIRSEGGEVVAIGMLVDARVKTVDFKGVPFYSLVEIETHRYSPAECPECKKGTSPVAVEF